jgi:hypothetical protein
LFIETSNSKTPKFLTVSNYITPFSTVEQYLLFDDLMPWNALAIYSTVELGLA